MDKIKFKDILNPETYKKSRSSMYREIQLQKKFRTLQIGPFMRVLFENRDTVIWQIQEVLRAEDGWPNEVQHEIESYVGLVPEPGMLTATVMLEICDSDERKQKLVDLKGICSHISLEFCGSIVNVQPIDHQVSDHDRAFSVNFLKFCFDSEQIAAAKGCDDAFFSVNHKYYSHRQQIESDLWKMLVKEMN